LASSNDLATMRGRWHGECSFTPLWPTLHTSEGLAYVQPTTSPGPPTRRRPESHQLSSPPAHQTPRPEQFDWIAMIIATAGAFGVGAEVFTLGSTDSTSAPAATTTAMRCRRMTNQTRSPLRSRRLPGSPHESPTLRSESRSLRRSASVLPVAASSTASSPSTSGYRS
jgi:hypothetical protein